MNSTRSTRRATAPARDSIGMLARSVARLGMAWRGVALPWRFTCARASIHHSVRPAWRGARAVVVTLLLVCVALSMALA